MAKKQEPLLLLEPKASRRLIGLLIAMHLLALAASVSNALPIVVKLALLTVICLHLWFIIKRFQCEVRKIRHTEALGWELSNGNDFEAIEILNSTVISIFAIFLHFNKNTLKQSVLIVNDALSEDDFRCFIVRLKTAGK